MNPSWTVARTKTISLCIGGMLVVGMSTAEAGGVEDGVSVLRVAGRCESYGPGLVDMGNGTCGRSATHVRVGTRAASINAWSTDGTSNAGLRSDASGMVPRAGDSAHLRVRSGLESLSPFR